MKRAIILHAMEQDSKGHWYPWLKAELEKQGYEVWVPDMPSTDMPDAQQTTNYLLSNESWDFKDNLLIGHSWGAVQILHLLQNLPRETKIKTAVLVSSFDHPAKGMEVQHEGLFKYNYNFAKIKDHADKFIYIHGFNDPWVPVDGAKNLANKTGGKVFVIKNGQHFSTSLDLAYKKFPKLVEILEDQKVI